MYSRAKAAMSGLTSVAAEIIGAAAGAAATAGAAAMTGALYAVLDQNVSFRFRYKSWSLKL